MTTLAAMGVVVAAVPSAAQLTTFCSGTASGVTIPGDLVVRAGDSCELSDVVIQGRTVVRTDANLLLTDSTAEGRLVVQNNGFAQLVMSEVTGNTRLNSAYGLYSQDSEHAGVVNVTDSEFFYSQGSRHSHNVRSTDSETFLESAWLTHNLTTSGDLYTDLYDTVVQRNVDVSDAELGSVVCASEIDGDASWTGNDTVVQLGGGPTPDCDLSVFGADVSLTDNAADISVIGNVIRGDLVCTDNTSSVTVADNRVRGADLCEATPSGTLSRSAGPDAGDRRDALQSKIEQRVAAGEQAAAGAGAAFTG